MKVGLIPAIATHCVACLISEAGYRHLSHFSVLLVSGPLLLHRSKNSAYKISALLEVTAASRNTSEDERFISP